MRQGGKWVSAVVLVVAVVSTATSQSGWTTKPVLAKGGMVSAAHPIAARVGARILARGGNAIDAMVATQMALNVVEPQSSGIGGGCFILFYDAKTKRTHFIDGREEVPSACRRSDFLTESGEVRRDASTGGAAAGVPGTVAAMWLAHQRFGRLPITDLLAPAIRLAADGVGVTPRLRASILANRDRLLRFPSSQAVFFRPDGTVPEIGDVWKQPDLAATLRLLADQGPDAFYRGPIARDIVRAVQQSEVQPGRMTLADLRRYRAVFRRPVRFRYRGYDIVSASPPSSGGITLGMMLGMLEQSAIGETAPGSVDELELWARVGSSAFADRNAYLGDADWTPEWDMAALLDRRRIARRAKAAWQHPPGQPMKPGPPPTAEGRSAPAAPLLPNGDEGRHTTHFTIVDRERNIVSCTSTIERGMGCALVVPGRGFLLNNELTDFDLGRDRGVNAVDATPRQRQTALDATGSPGGKRPRSSMTPVIVFKNGRPRFAVGSPGGPWIIGTVAQIIVNVIDRGMDMQQAIAAPRVNCRNGPVSLEIGFADRSRLVAELRRRGWKVAEPVGEGVWGGAHGIRLRPDGLLEGGADPRREGAARGDGP